MKILFDLTALFDHLTGIERYNLNISKCIIRNHPENKYILLFKNQIHEEFTNFMKQDNVECHILKGTYKLLFIQWRIYKELIHIDADYYVFLSFTSPMLFRHKGIINAIHDMTCIDYPETMSNKMVYYFRLTDACAIKNSCKIVTISKFSQKRICDIFHVEKDFVPIIYCGLSENFIKPYTPINLSKKYSIPKEYILSLSTIEPRKNLQLLIKAYHELTNEGVNLPDLVLAGRKGWKLEDIIDQPDYRVINKIHFTGFIDDEDLSQLYHDAELFVFPSLYEGFGLPVIEAMSQGTKVISSNSSSLPEVVSNYAILFESNDLADLKYKIRKQLEHTNDKDLKAVSYVRQTFDWSRESEILYQIMKR